MALNFGYDEHPPNHIHNIKPLVALPYYQLFTTSFAFFYDTLRTGNRWPALGTDGAPRRDILTVG